MWSLIAVVAVVACAATYLTWTAGRVDRLHARAASATRALDAHLVRRAAAAAVLAEERAAPDLYAAARAALDAAPQDREAAENDLTWWLRTVSPVAADPVWDAVATAGRRVALARQVHTDLVRDALTARRRPLVRLLRLTHRHARPAYFDIEDPVGDLSGTIPAQLPAPVVALGGNGPVSSATGSPLGAAAGQPVAAAGTPLGAAATPLGSAVVPAARAATGQATGP